MLEANALARFCIFDQFCSTPDDDGLHAIQAMAAGSRASTGMPPFLKWLPLRDGAINLIYVKQSQRHTGGAIEYVRGQEIEKQTQILTTYLSMFHPPSACRFVRTKTLDSNLPL